MRRDVVLALSLASMSGFFAAFGAYNWMPSGERTTLALPAKPQIELTTVVVAKTDLAFGSAISVESLTESQWPVANVPEGSFKTISELLREQENRVVLEAMRAKEPVLRGKISGPGQRATLANMLGEGKKAVSIRVNDVMGVSGFVLPGDFVDLLVTVEPKEEDGKKSESKLAYTDLLLEKVRVLAVDQTFDPKLQEPKLGRTVTVEATLEESQKITLASTVGTLSLVLRNSAAQAKSGEARRIEVSDLSGDNGDNKPKATLQPTNAVAEPPPPVPPVERKDGDGMKSKPAGAKISVYRGEKSSDYTVTRAAQDE